MERDTRTPILLASAVIIRDGRVIVTRHDDSTAWHLPDGQVRFGETAVECLRRSLAEDLGIPQDAATPETLQPFHVSQTIRLLNDRHYVTLHYKVAIKASTRLRPRDGLEIDDLPPSKVLGLPTFESTRAALVALGYRHVDD